MNSIIILCYVYCFIIGTCITSFMNVIVDRVPRHEDFVHGRSHCESCGHTLKWYDLIPLLSYVLLRGKCRYCKTKIPARGFFVELFGGLVAMFCFYRYQFSIETVLLFVVGMILLAITLIDFDTMIIPDGLNIALFIVCFVLCLVRHNTLLDALLGMLCISLPMFILILLIPDCFGGGDVKLMFASGVALGWKYSLLAAFIGILVAGIYCIYLLLSRKISKKAHIAFGPYLSLGIFIALVYGTEIVSWYINLLM